MKFKLIFISYFLYFPFAVVHSQITSRLTVIRGNSVYFTMNSLNKLQNGLEYTNWTEFDVFFDDLGAPLNNWQLTVHTTSLNIAGDGGNNLPLNTIYIRATSPSANTPIALGGWIALSTVATEVLNTGIQGANLTVNVSYRCGMAPATSMSTAVTDYYYVDLIFTLGPD